MSAFLVVLGTILVFLIFRALVLWYWRLDRIVELLENIDDKLDVIADSDGVFQEAPSTEHLAPSIELNHFCSVLGAKCSVLV